MSYCLNALKGGYVGIIEGSIIGGIKGDIRSLGAHLCVYIYDYMYIYIYLFTYLFTFMVPAINTNDLSIIALVLRAYNPHTCRDDSSHKQISIA